MEEEVSGSCMLDTHTHTQSDLHWVGTMGRSLRIWIPSPGPMWATWLKLVGLEMSLFLISGSRSISLEAQSKKHESSRSTGEPPSTGSKAGLNPHVTVGQTDVAGRSHHREDLCSVLICSDRTTSNSVLSRPHFKNTF